MSVTATESLGEKRTHEEDQAGLQDELKAAFEAAKRIALTQGTGTGMKTEEQRADDMVSDVLLEIQRDTEKKAKLGSLQQRQLNNLFAKRVDINDSRHRFLLTKPDTLLALQEDTGALVVVRGKYLPDRTLATTSIPALCLEACGPTESCVDKAAKVIQEILETGKLNDRLKQIIGKSEPERKATIQDQVFLSFEPDFYRMPTYNIVGKIQGPSVRQDLF